VTLTQELTSTADRIDDARRAAARYRSHMASHGRLEAEATCSSCPKARVRCSLSRVSADDAYAEFLRTLDTLKGMNQGQYASVLHRDTLRLAGEAHHRAIVAACREIGGGE
jgi:hypothetical protein